MGGAALGRREGRARLGAGGHDLAPLHLAEAVAALDEVARGVEPHDLLADAARPPRLDLVPVPKHLPHRPSVLRRRHGVEGAVEGAVMEGDLAPCEAAAVVELARRQDADERALAAAGQIAAAHVRAKWPHRPSYKAANEDVCAGKSYVRRLAQ
jgi:hypothetical protein